MPSITDIKPFIFIVFGVLLINIVLVEIAKVLRSSKPSKYGDGTSSRRSLPTAMALYIIVILIDVAFAAWLYYNGEPYLEDLYNWFSRLFDSSGVL